MIEFLNKHRPSGYQQLVAIHPVRGDNIKARTFNTPLTQEVHSWVEDLNNNGYNLYFSVNPLRTRLSKKARKQDILAGEYCHVDIDPDLSDSFSSGRSKLIDELVPELVASPIPPSFIVDSGNGLGVFYRLTNPSDAPKVEYINSALITKYQGDSGTGNIDRIMRLPDTINYPSAAKIQKGYPTQPSRSQVLFTSGSTYTIAELASELPIPPTVTNDDKNDEIDKGSEWDDDRAAAANKKLKSHLEEDFIFKARWEGSKEGLTDQSGSAMDMSMMAMLKARGFDFSESVYLLLPWPHGSETTRQLPAEQRKRQLERTWTRSLALSASEVAIKCIKAHESGESWEGVLHQCKPSHMVKDQVLKALAAHGDFAGKRELNADYKQHLTLKKEQALPPQLQFNNRQAILWNSADLNGMEAKMSKILKGSTQLISFNSLACTSKPVNTCNPIDIEMYCQTKIDFQGRSDTGDIKSIAIPNKALDMLMKRSQQVFLTVSQFINHPTITSSGRVINTEGYDAETRYFADFNGCSFPEIGKCTREDAMQARNILLDEMFGEFEYADDGLSHEVALAAFLTAIARGSMPIAPLFLFSARIQASGKTTQAAIINWVLTGKDITMTPAIGDISEQQKQLTTTFMEGREIICLDNLKDGMTYSNPSLCQAATSDIVRWRVLGVSNNAEINTRSTIIMTGNRVTLDIDLATRTIESRLEPKSESPEQRLFKVRDISQNCLENRSRWITAGLVILKAYYDNHKPTIESVESRFSTWNDLVVKPIIFAGGVDVAKSFAETTSKSDERIEQHQWIMALRDYFGLEKAFMAKDIVSLYHRFSEASKNGSVVNFESDHEEHLFHILQLKFDPTEMSAKKVGWKLKADQGIVIDGVQLNRERSTHKGDGLKWMINTHAW